MNIQYRLLISLAIVLKSLAVFANPVRYEKCRDKAKEMIAEGKTSEGVRALEKCRNLEIDGPLLVDGRPYGVLSKNAKEELVATAIAKCDKNWSSLLESILEQRKKWIENLQAANKLAMGESSEKAKTEAQVKEIRTIRSDLEKDLVPFKKNNKTKSVFLKSYQKCKDLRLKIEKHAGNIVDGVDETKPAFLADLKEIQTLLKDMVLNCGLSVSGKQEKSVLSPLNVAIATEEILTRNDIQDLVLNALVLSSDQCGVPLK